jgi:hypothetical protein
MKLHLLLILLDTPQHLVILHPHSLQQRRQILHREMPIRTTMRLARSRRVFSQDLLATERAISIPSPIAIPAYIAVGMPHIIAIFLIKLIIRDLIKPTPPEHKAFLEIQAYAFEEECILQPAIVFEMRVPPQRTVEVLHAQREGRGERVDVAR